MKTKIDQETAKNPAAIFCDALLELVRQAVREEVRDGIREALNNHQKEDRVLDVKGAAAYLKYSENWVHRHWKAVGGRKAGREIRFFQSDLEKWARGENQLSRRGR